jgi:hypothetical protein
MSGPTHFQLILPLRRCHFCFASVKSWSHFLATPPSLPPLHACSLYANLVINEFFLPITRKHWGKIRKEFLERTNDTVTPAPSMGKRKHTVTAKDDDKSGDETQTKLKTKKRAYNKPNKSVTTVVKDEALEGQEDYEPVLKQEQEYTVKYEDGEM